MSGVEIVGFVLGGFPLLISAAEHYKEGFEPLVKWKRFRTDFIGFIDAVDIEKQLFDQMLERFLISADVSEQELQCFMTIPNYEGWKRKDLVEVLQSRLGSSYAVFSSTIRTMEKLMEELQTLLLLKNGEVDWASHGASKWDYQLKRIHLSFSKKGSKTLASLESHNRKLRELLDSNDKLDSLKATRKDTAWGSIFECIRKHANSLHTALTNGWQCDCADPHLAGLRLQRRITASDKSFNMSFGLSQEPTKPRNIQRREIVLRIREDADTEEPPAKPNVPVKQEYLTSLRQNFETKSKSTPDVNDMPRPGLPVSMSSSATSQLKEYFSKSGSGVSRVSGLNGTTVVVEESQRNWLSSRIPKPKKSVRLDLPAALPIRPTPTQTPMVPATAPAPAPALLSVLQPTIEIKDLCSTLSAAAVNVECLGYLCDEQNKHHELRPVEEAQSFTGDETIVSLDTLLTGPERLSRYDRYKVASIIASSLLQLQSTPWLTDKMEKKSIFFYRHGSKVLIECPYVRQSFSSVKTVQQYPTTNQSRFAARNSLSHLGILLLELCFGQTIETQDTWKSYLGPDGKPHQGTDYMAARDWAEMVCEEEPAFEHIVKCCVFCVFEEKADWENKRFTQAVYASVVAPLEKIISKWPAA